LFKHASLDEVSLHAISDIACSRGKTHFTISMEAFGANSEAY
jgi:hypothetical protein